MTDKVFSGQRSSFLADQELPFVNMVDTVPTTSNQELSDAVPVSNLAIASWCDWTKVRAAKYVKIAISCQNNGIVHTTKLDL